MSACGPSRERRITRDRAEVEYWVLELAVQARIPLPGPKPRSGPMSSKPRRKRYPAWFRELEVWFRRPFSPEEP